MNIVLTHGYFLHDDPKEKAIMKPYPPLGLLYLSAYLEQHGFDNQVFDSTFSNFDKLKEFLLLEKPKIVGIYTNLMTKMRVLPLITFIRNHELLKDTKIILGGPEVKNHAEAFLKHGAHVLVMGEGEETTLELVEYYRQEHTDKNLIEIKGIAYLDKHNKLVTTQERSLIKNLDELPLPNRNKIDLPQYFNTWKNKHGQSVVSISTMRGCPYTCKWCSRAVYGQSYRRRSAALVVQEMLLLKATYNPDAVWFVDDVFTVSHKWLKEFAEAVKQNKLHFSYEIITRADRMNEEVISLLKESGCYRVWIGAESGSQRIIDAMDRRVNVKQVRDMIQATRNAGMEAGTFIMLGYPGETKADIEETVHHLVSSNPNWYTLTLAYPIKGTPLYEEVTPNFTNFPDWDKGTDRDIDFKRTYPRKFYTHAIRYVYNEVAFQQEKNKPQTNILKLIKLKLKSTAAKTTMNIYSMKQLRINQL